MLGSLQFPVDPAPSDVRKRLSQPMRSLLLVLFLAAYKNPPRQRIFTKVGLASRESGGFSDLCPLVVVVDNTPSSD